MQTQTGIGRFVPSDCDDLKNGNDKKISYQVTKQEVIEIGLHYLEGVGSDAICRVCIPNGGSCCEGCRSLADGVGCQLRNTSCTAWLCGFLKFVYYEAGLLQGWMTFWGQVPGQDFREDFTPSRFHVEQWLKTPDIRFLSEALAEDLLEQKDENDPYWLIEIKETFDQYIDEIMDFDDPEVTRSVKKELAYLTKDFRHLHLAKKQLLAMER